MIDYLTIAEVVRLMDGIWGMLFFVGQKKERKQKEKEGQLNVFLVAPPGNGPFRRHVQLLVFRDFLVLFTAPMNLQYQDFFCVMATMYDNVSLLRHLAPTVAIHCVSTPVAATTSS